MSAGVPLQFEDVSPSILGALYTYARLDQGPDALRRDVPAWGSDTPYPRAVVNEVHRLATVTADLIEGVGRG